MAKKDLMEEALEVYNHFKEEKLLVQLEIDNKYTDPTYPVGRILIVEYAKTDIVFDFLFDIIEGENTFWIEQPGRFPIVFHSAEEVIAHIEMNLEEEALEC